MSEIHNDYRGEESKRSGTSFDRLPAIGSGLFGTFLSGAFVVLYWDKHPEFKPAAALLFFLCASVIGSYAWHWLFYLRPRDLSNRLQEESRRQQQSKDDPAPPPLHPH